VSPLHVQASTTAASEALYLLLWVCALERLLAALTQRRLTTFAIAGLLASLAAVTRYDAWLALPIAVLAALIFSAGERRRLIPGLAVFSLCAASLPVAWMAWGARAGGDPLFFAHYIMTDHAGLAADMAGRFGPLLGRARQLGIWSPGVRRDDDAAGPAGGRPSRSRAAGDRGRWRRRRCGSSSWRRWDRRRCTWCAARAAELRAAGAVRDRSGAHCCCQLAATAVPAVRARGFRVATAAAAARSRSRSGWSRRSGAIASGRRRVDGSGDRARSRGPRAARHLRAQRRPHEPVMIEPVAFAEIGIAHAAGVPGRSRSR
jgi:hypothetical protein